MKILVVGGGGREHAILRKLKENRKVETLFVLPGNGGMEGDAIPVPIGPKETEKIVEFAVKEQIDYAVVVPDDPLVLGTVDRLNEKGIPAFGPKANAAIIEGSKAFSKNLMKKYGIPTASYEIFDNLEKAVSYVEQSTVFPLVIKADGLALGKGVIIAENKNEALQALHSMMEDHAFGKSGDTVVIEEFLEGPEVSVLAFTDGKVLRPLASSMDHKRIGEHDTGLNTGGMGTVAPNPYYTEDVEKQCMNEIFIPTIRAMEQEGRPFQGCLYFGLMLTKTGPKVIEYNCRFGDPETQVVLPLMKEDLLTVMMACTNQTLHQITLTEPTKHCCCVIMASKGYPVSYEKGFEITLPEKLKNHEQIFIAGAKKENGKLYTNGGRVLGAVAVGSTLKEAVDSAYDLTSRIQFENSYIRRDIGKRALEACKNN